MRRHWALAATALCVTGVAGFIPSSGASAKELIKELDCALIQTTHTGSDYCLKVINTCNTPIVSRIEEQGGIQKDSPQIPHNERGKVCSNAPFTFLGSYIAGPLADGAGD